MKNICAQLQEEAKKKQKAIEARIDKWLSTSKGKRQDESTIQVTQYPLDNDEPVGQYAFMRGGDPMETVVERVRE